MFYARRTARGCPPAPAMRPIRSDLEVAQNHAPDHEPVAAAQIRLLDTAAVHERAVRAAVIEDPRTGGPGDEDRVTPRDRALVEAQVGGQTTADVHRVLLQPNHQRLVGPLDFD